jgi:ABC-type multidrug transport system permease subunit
MLSNQLIIEETIIRANNPIDLESLITTYIKLLSVISPQIQYDILRSMFALPGTRLITANVWNATAGSWPSAIRAKIDV